MIGLEIETLLLISLFTTLLTLALTDWKYRKLPNTIVMLYLIQTLLYIALNIPHCPFWLATKRFIEFLFAFYLLYKLKIIAGGDLKVLSITSVLIDGEKMILSFSLALLLSSISVIYFNNLKRREDRYQPPLVTYFVIVLIIVLISSSFL